MMNAPIVAIRFSVSQPRPSRVGVRAAGLALEAEEVHREEREVEPDDHQPERQSCRGVSSSIRPKNFGYQ